MGKTVDERVVEMRFDNKQFENNAKQSMNTLERLKQALNFSTSKDSLEALDRTARNMSFDGIAKGVDALASRFSTLGIVGMRVIENLTDSIMSFTKKGVNFLTDSIVSGGLKRAQNIENAHFQLQALLKDEEKVQAVMKQANDSVDGTAYGYDVAAKAASMFAASGIEAGEKMETALKGIVGVASMTSSEYEDISRIFTTVAGNGRLMGDQLLQLSTRGLNAAATLADYFKEFRGEVNMTEADIREMVSAGELDFNTFASAMTWAFGESALRANETFTGALSNMKSALARIGQGFYSPLIEQNSAVIGLFNGLRERINDVKKALVFDESIGNVNALSKQFTDAVLRIANVLNEKILNADLSTPLQIFYYNLESVKNVFKGLYSIVKPVGEAFGEVFLTFSSDSVAKLAERIEKLTSKMKLSKKNSKNLHDAFKGVFSVVKLLSDGFFKLLKAIVPLNKPVDSLGTGILSLAGSLGRLLTKFTDFVRKSPTVQKGFDIFSKAISALADVLVKIIEGIDDFAIAVYNLPITQEIISALTDAFKNLGELAAPYIESVTDALKKFGTQISNLKIEDITSKIQSFGESIKSFFGGAKTENEGLKTFSNNVKEFGTNVKEAFTFDEAIKNANTWQEKISALGDWAKEKLPEFFSNVSFGDLAAGAGGIGIIYAVIKAIKALKSINVDLAPLKTVKDTLGAVKNTLNEYQKDLKATAILKIAGAIGILALSLTVLSFADPKRLMDSAIALGVVAVALGFGISKLLNATSRAREVGKGLDGLASNLGQGLKKLGAAVKIKAIGSAIKDFGKTILLISASIAGLAYVYQKDPEAFKAASTLVAEIVATLVSIMAGFTLLGGKLDKGAETFRKTATAVLILSGSVLLIALAVQKIYKITLPEDYATKNKILIGIAVGLVSLILAVGGASRLAKGNGLQTGPILAAAAGIFLIIEAVKRFYAVELPKKGDLARKNEVLIGILAGLAGLIFAVAGASRISKGNGIQTGALLAATVGVALVIEAVKRFYEMKLPKKGELTKKNRILLAIFGALLSLIVVINTVSKGAKGLSGFASILAMCAFIGTCVIALKVLGDMSSKKLMKGAVSLGAILLVLAADMEAVSKISNKEVYKTVLAMAVMVGAIVASLAILSMLSVSDLAKSGAALGSMLLVMAVDFLAISKMSNSKVMGTIISMVASVVVIAASLYQLAKQPWKNLLASAGSLSMVLLAMSGAIAILSMIRVDLTTIGAIALGIAAVIGVALSLKILTGEDTNALLAAGEALTKVLLAMSAAMAVSAIIGLAGPSALIGILILDAFIANFALVLYALGKLTQSEDTKKLLAGGLAALSMIGQAIGDFIGNIVGNFLGSVTSSLPAIGENLSSFMDKANPFFSGLKNIDAESMNGIKALAQTLLILTANELLSGITNFLGGEKVDLVAFGEQLVSFAPKIKTFAGIVEGIDPESVKGAAAAAEIMATTAKKLPSTGGLLQKFLGEKVSLSDFGMELVKFAPSLVIFATAVKDITEDMVSGAAAGAELMAKVAKGLPSIGGLKDKIIGEKMTLTDFGEELVNFAPSLVDFATQVQDIKKKHVSGAAAAAELMSSLAEGLPNSGGLAGKIFGENDLSDFGDELVLFAPDIVEFANTVKDVKKKHVEGAASVIEIMSNLAENLPNSGGVVGFFAGNNDIDDFGKKIAKFGESLMEYYKKIKDLPAGKLVVVGNAVEALANVAIILDDINMEIFPEFSKNLKKAGTDAIEKFAKAFEESDKKVSKAIDKLKNNLINYIAKVEPEISKSFREKGNSLIASFTNGMNDAYNLPVNSVNSISRNVINSFNNSMGYNTFYPIGQNVSLGLIDGINSEKDALIKASVSLAVAAANATKKALDERSPSRVTHKLGEYFSIGLANGILSQTKSVEDASEALAENSIDILQEAVYKMLDMIGEETEETLVITPVLDLSNVENGVKTISSLFTGRDLNLNSTYGNALSASSSFEKKFRDLEREAKENKSTPVNNFNYTQNNYSPKALSRIEIYRNTRNQLSSLKGAMNRS